MIKVALTGSIATGKSTVLKMFAELGCAVWSADKIVHSLYESQDVISFIQSHFPQVLKEGKVDRKLLGDHVFRDKQALQKLEAFMHPLVAQNRDAFLKKNMKKDVLVFEIPLLFEKNLQEDFDITLVTNCVLDTQIKRLMERPGIDAQKALGIIDAQMPLAMKVQKADDVIDTDQDFESIRKQISQFLEKIKSHA